jgi:uracil phosphoribosyltransferase
MNFDNNNSNVHPLRPNNQILGLHTIIRDKTCSREDFIFYSNRLIRLVIEEALSLLPCIDKTVVTPTGCEFKGVAWTGKIAGVSIMRSGESMEIALRDVCKDVRIGKILIQRNEEDATPTLIYHKLPEDISDRYVLLLDPMLATGGSALRAIDLLVENYNVPENHIIFCNLLAAPEGIHTLTDKYPNVKIITTHIDTKLNERSYITPGLGDFGDRYFGNTLS